MGVTEEPTKGSKAWAGGRNNWKEGMVAKVWGNKVAGIRHTRGSKAAGIRVGRK